MPTGFNPFAIPSVPSLPSMPLPKIDPNAGLKALMAVQESIAKQQLMAARAAAIRSGGGGGGGGGEAAATNPKYTNYIDLPDGKGGFETVPVVGADEKGRAARAKQLWDQRISQLAAQDKDFAESMGSIGKLSVRGQKLVMDKARQQHLPRLFKQWNLPQNMHADAVRLLTNEANANIKAQEDAIKETGAMQSLADSLKLAYYSIRDAIRGIGATPEEKFAMGQARAQERQAIIDSNAHLREEELRRREGNDSWTDFFEHPGLNVAEALGDVVGGVAPLMGGQVAGAAGAGALLRAIPTPVTQGLATVVQLGGAALGGGAVGATMGPIELQDRVIAEMNAGNLTREQAMEAIQQGELPAQIVGGIVGGIPLGVAQTGLPSALPIIGSRGANTMFGRRYIQKTAEKEAAERLATTAAPTVAQSQINAAAKIAGQNAVSDAIAAEAGRGFLGRWGSAVVPTSLDLGALSALNTMGQNWAYGTGTGQDVPITQGAGQAFLSGAAMGPVFGVLNARRPYVPARQEEPKLPMTGETLGLPGGTGERVVPPFTANSNEAWRQRGYTNQADFNAEVNDWYRRRNAYQEQEPGGPRQAASYRPTDDGGVVGGLGAGGPRPNRPGGGQGGAKQQPTGGHGPEGYYQWPGGADPWAGYTGRRGFTEAGTNAVNNIAKKYGSMGNRGALKVKNDISEALARGDITLDDVMRVADTYANTNPMMYSNLRRSVDDYLMHWRHAEQAKARKQQTSNSSNNANVPPQQPRRSQNSKQAKQAAQNTVYNISPEVQEAQLKNIFYQMLYNEEISPAAMRLITKKSGLTPAQKLWAEDAIQNFMRYAPHIRKQIEDIYANRQQGLAENTERSGRTTPPLGVDGQLGEGRADQSNPAGNRPATTNPEAAPENAANPNLERPVGRDTTTEGGGDAGLPTQDSRAAETTPRIAASETGQPAEPANREPGGGQSAERVAEPDTGQRGNQPETGASPRSDGTTEPTGRDQPDNVNPVWEQVARDIENQEATERAVFNEEDVRQAFAEDNFAKSIEDIGNTIAAGETPSKTITQQFRNAAREYLENGGNLKDMRDEIRAMTTDPATRKLLEGQLDNVRRSVQRREKKQSEAAKLNEQMAAEQGRQAGLRVDKNEMENTTTGEARERTLNSQRDPLCGGA